MRVIVVGSRNWAEFDPVWRDLATVFHHCGGNGIDPVTDLTVVTGACPTGADFWAHQWATSCVSLGLRTVHPEQHPADWATLGRRAGPIRNQAMVAPGADLMLAYPLGLSRGTRGCMDLARKAGIWVHDYTADGPLKVPGRAGCLLCKGGPLTIGKALRGSP